MNSQLTAFITLSCTSGVLNLYLCLYVFLKRYNYTKIAQLFISYTALIAVYCFASAFGLIATTLSAIKVWTAIQYVGMAFSTPLGLLFIMQYLGFHLTRKKIMALIAIPFISLIMVATNDIHHFHYRVFEIDPILGAPYIHQEIGIWYIIHGIFTFGCMFVSFLLVLIHWKETTKAYRQQLIALMCGQLIPMITAFIYLLGLTPQGVDPVPMVLWASSFLYLWSINSSRLFRVMPVAKDAIFHSINDGVIVLDESARLIEFNQACSKVFPQLTRSMISRDIGKTWIEVTGQPMPFTLEAVVNTQDIEMVLSDHTYQVRVTELQHVNHGKGLLLIFTDITELKELQRQLEQLAFYDELTQIYNRRAFFQQCNQAYSEARESSSAFTVILMDIDHFKNVNDTYGHAIGDQLLVHVVKVCQSVLKKGELFARYGGEEFVLALKDSTLLEGQALANLLCNSVESQPLMTTEGAIRATISCGVAEGTKGQETLYQLLNNADKALYAAKQAGRNRVHVFLE
ncbi:histidine kinase N-terminal 7TM domain-containing protein [Lysinibacillus capsici]|uniref:histidine kinase N-terminal 7TM domain-containing diguanylate cyclase n=1 Tax=Lysinibacillus capsici TaxID=2115968 RepID=UPI00272EF437|nr:histidine kinase N-terminal 7TM domain-containing protein [Lysinibacillus capsici]MDP1395691.1 diguanylate cyclase [Lysinibacillus capsici]MDP1416154.1 diguanylate cyclase [Lysinibacillus capsici]MDP1432053.1 diguanylate cyclase [Lysinibacillus capsici]